MLGYVQIFGIYYNVVCFPLVWEVQILLWCSLKSLFYKSLCCFRLETLENV